MNSINSISPIDGRYRKNSEALSNYFSERALIKYRIIIEGEYIISLSEHSSIDLRKFTEKEKKFVRSLYEISEEDALRVKEIESVTNHDVKAVEYYLKEKFSKNSLRDTVEWLHFALTSEDVNNMAYALMIRDALSDVIIPSLTTIQKELDSLALKNLFPMLARTHGQPATPTVFGKEIRIFWSRLERQVQALKSLEILVKLNGATGNYNAQVAAYPKVDWQKFTAAYIKKLNSDKRKNTLTINVHTTQIEPHDTYAEIFDTCKRINVILTDFSQDIWRYISDGWIIQKALAGEIGSSTMPHKVNPIDFENAEGNFGIANALFGYFGLKLPISRLQRDLSDSTVERNFGVAFAHSLIGYKALLKGLGKISPNKEKIISELNKHPEVLAEAIQVILRREAVEKPYEKLKELTRGKEITLKDISTFIDTLPVSDKVKKELKHLTPENYIGIGKELAKNKKQ